MTMGKLGMTCRISRPVRWRAAASVPALLVLALGLSGCGSPTYFPPIYVADPAALEAGGLPAGMSDSDTSASATLTRWWIAGSEDPLEEVRRLSRTSPKEIPSPREMLGEGQPISRRDIVTLVMAGNPDIRISDADRRAAIEAVTARRGQVYDMVMTARAAERSTEDPVNSQRAQTDSTLEAIGFTAATSDASTDKTQVRSGRGGLSQKLFTGGTVELFYEESKTERDYDPRSGENPVRNAEAGIGLTQPLLRGFGREVTEQPILNAQFQRQIQEEGFRGSIIRQLALALKTYDDLIFALENAAVQRISLQQALDLLEINISRERVGDLAIVDVEQARANAASREEQYIIAMQNVFDTQDLLRQSLNSDMIPEWGWDRAFLPLDVPVYRDDTPTEMALLQQAYTQRSDWRQALISIDQALLNERVAHNLALPQLDFVGSFRNLGEDSDANDAREDVKDDRYDAYEVALEFSYPLLNREGRATIRQRKIEREKTQLELARLALAIRTEIRTRLRAFSTNRVRIDVTRKAVEAEQIKYDAELKRYEVGLSTSFQLLEFLEDLSTAKVNHLRAIVDYQKSSIDLQESSGSLFADLGLLIGADTILPTPDYQAMTEEAGAPGEALPIPAEIPIPPAQPNVAADTTNAPQAEEQVVEPESIEPPAIP